MDPKFVIGFDGSDHARDAVAVAVLLAEASGARLIVAGVYPRPALVEPGEGIDVVLRERTERTLAEAISLAGDRALTVVAVAGSSPAQGLQELALEQHPDVIVVGSSRHGFIGHVFAGSVSERLLHGAPCPIAIAPSGYATGGRHALNDIGVGFDDSPEAWEALTAAGALAGAADARLHVISATGTHAGLFMTSPFAVGEYAAYAANLREQEQRQLDAAVARLRDLHVDAVAESAQRPAGALLTARSRELDLLVVGSRSYGPMGRVLLGSVSAHLARRSACPLLVTPRGAGLPNAPLDAAAREDHRPISILKGT